MREAHFIVTESTTADRNGVTLDRKRLAETMYKARHEAGLTQQELAERLGTRQAYIAALESGRRNITFVTLAKYAAACGKKVAVDFL